MALKSLEQACVPRQSVFDPSIRDTVYNIDDLHQIDAQEFFAENYVTDGMRQLLSEAIRTPGGEVAGDVRRLPAQPVDGRRQNAQPARPRAPR